MASRPLFSDPNSTEVIEEPADDRPEKPADGPVKTGRKRKWRRAVIIVLSVLVLLAGGGALAATLYVRSVDHDIKRIEAFEAVPEAARPPKVEAAKDALNFLVLGSDSRDPENAGGSRSDTIIVLHLTKEIGRAHV